ncbi:MAG: NYN domain-containing protein [Desulfarculales bacterium]|jgi:hypothetical protein|nr:NYN domain-containing protein [Desulfarculales bacterium]
MHWLIDANNLVHLIPEIISSASPQERPLALASLLRPYRDMKKLKITLFFDGGEKQYSTSLNGIPSRFSGPEKSADQIILEYLAQQNDCRGLILVSNDSGLNSSASRQGAGIIPASRFLHRMLSSQGMDEDQEEKEKFSTRKKGPARRLPKNKRREDKLLRKL